jgi:hypothetical protein
MSDLIRILDAFPEAALLTDQGLVTAANPMARHYLPQLEPGAPVPSYLLLPPDGPSAGQFTAGLSVYSFRCTQLPEGQLVLFSPAPQTALTDTQLDGVLRQLRGFLSEFLVEAESLPPEEKADFSRSFYRMFRLVDNLDQMRLAGGKEGMPFRPVTMDLAGLCRQTVGEAETLFRGTGIQLDYQSSRPSLLIPGDPQLLRRLLLELLSNAIRAAGQGVISLRLRSVANRAVLTLTHSGPAPTQRQVAAMLQQDADAGLPPPGAGAGLGLPLVRHIAALHGGAFLVECGQGAPTMLLSLPTGPLSPRVTVSTPTLQRDGGLSPLLVALADVLPPRIFQEAEADDV